MGKGTEDYDTLQRMYEEQEPLDAELKRSAAHGRQIAAEYVAAKETTLGDGKLSGQGKADGVVEARAKFDAVVDRWRDADLTPALAAVAAEKAAQEAMVLEAAGPDPSQHDIAQLADRLRGFDAVERQSLYASADARTRRAMELAPPLPVRRPDGGLAWEPAIDHDTAERFHEAARAAVDPESTRRLRQLERRAGVLRALVGTVRTLIRDGLR